MIFFGNHKAFHQVILYPSTTYLNSGFIRWVHTTPATLFANKPVKLKAKGSSQEWLRRQMADPYVERSKMLNLRCRSAFKLMEIDDRFKILKPGQVVIDCGAAPGSWSQVAVNRTNADDHNEAKPIGKVIGIDILPVFPLKGAEFINNSDFTTEQCQSRLVSMLDGKRIDCVLSDMAPKASGIRILDQENIMSLCNSVLEFALKMSSTHATLLVKVWDNGQAPDFIKKLEEYYAVVKSVKPNSSRGDSAEKFILARFLKENSQLIA